MPPDEIRVTLQVLRVLEAMVHQPDGEFYGSELTDATGLKSGTVYPILARLERAGWATSAWEPTAPAELGRPRRRHYKLTGVGSAAARRHLYAAPGRQVGPVPSPAWGTLPSPAWGNL